MSIHDKAMLIRLGISQWDAMKFDKTVSDKTLEMYHADRSAGRFNKHLIPRDALKPIRDVATSARSYHYTNTLPWDDTGRRLLPSKNYLNYTSQMRQFHDSFDNAVAQFVDKYPLYVQKARERLQDMYDETDYPSVDQVVAKFNFFTDVEPMPNADDFRIDVNEEEVTRIQKSIESRVNRSVEEALNDLWKRIEERVSHMYTKLSDPDSKFKNSLVENIRELVHLAPRLNVLDDPHIDHICQQMEANLCKFDASDLRTNELARIKTAEEAAKIIEQMSSYMGAAA